MPNELEYIRIASEMRGRELTEEEMEYLGRIDSLIGTAEGIYGTEGHLQSRQVISLALVNWDLLMGMEKRKADVL